MTDLEDPRRSPHLHLPGAGDPGTLAAVAEGLPEADIRGRRRGPRRRLRRRRTGHPDRPHRRRLVFATKPAHDREVRRLLQIERQEPAVVGRPRDAGRHRLPPARDPVRDIGHPGRRLDRGPEDPAREEAHQDRGAQEGPRQPLVYRTSEEFLLYLGLDSLAELPSETEIAKILEEEKAVDA
ncbi:MAG: hypothetical protein MZU95_04540 [Desulfomicrobium escambiense]|nr:hypothetical protein [Desulfomicrobium escambiense]